MRIEKSDPTIFVKNGGRKALAVLAMLAMLLFGRAQAQ